MLTKLRSVEEQLERAERARDEAVSKAMGTYPGKPAPTVPPAEVGRHAAYPAAEKETVGGRVSRRLPELERLTAGSLDPKMQSGDPRRVKDLLDSFGEEEYLVTWTKRSTSKGGEFGELGTMRVGKPPARKHIDELGEALKEKTDDELREMLRAQGVTHRAGRTAEGKPYKEAIESLPRERLLIEIYKGQGAAISGAGEAYDPSKYLLRRVYSKTAEERGGKGPFWRHVPLNNVKQVIGPDGAVYRFGPAGEPVRMPVADPTPAKPTVPSPAGPPVKRPEPAPSTTPPPAKPAEKPAPTPPERVLVDTAGKEARFEQPIEPVWEAAKKPIPPRPEAPRRPPRPAREPIWAKIGREAPEPASAPAPHAEAPTPTWSPQKRGTPLYRAGLKLKMGSEKVEDIGRRVTELVPRAGYTILRRVLGRGHVSPVDSFAGGALGAATAFLGPSAALQTAAGVTGAGLGIQALGKAGKAVAYLMMTDRGRLMERAARSAPGRIAIKAKAALDALDKGNEARYRALVYLLARDRSFQDWFTGIEAEEQERDRQAG
jgi:hypothetical protein